MLVSDSHKIPCTSLPQTISAGLDSTPYNIMPTSLDAHSTPVRHGKFYFSDGNVIFRVSVLVTRTTRQYILSECYDLQVKETLYKLHKSLLAGDSDVFAGMFSLSDAFDTTPNPKNLVLKHFEGALFR